LHILFLLKALHVILWSPSYFESQNIFIFSVLIDLKIGKLSICPSPEPKNSNFWFMNYKAMFILLQKTIVFRHINLIKWNSFSRTPGLVWFCKAF
jgi:hypothetical protein